MTDPTSANISGDVDPKLLEILVCPMTKGPLEYDRIRGELISRSARLAYPVRKGAPVMLADEAYHIGPPPSAESYLNIPKIIEVAKKSATYGFSPPVKAGAAALQRFSSRRDIKLVWADLTTEPLPIASTYFIYDYGTIAAIERLLAR